MRLFTVLHCWFACRMNKYSSIHTHIDCMWKVCPTAIMLIIIGLRAQLRLMGMHVTYLMSFHPHIFTYKHVRNTIQDNYASERQDDVKLMRSITAFINACASVWVMIAIGARRTWSWEIGEDDESEISWMPRPTANALADQPRRWSNTPLNMNYAHNAQSCCHLNGNNNE